jgi:predicted TIM-barrel fold metal-dependent hydrolase
MDDQIWDPVYQLANDRELAVISHTGSEETCWPILVENIARRFPKANFVIGHSGNAEPHRTQAIEAANRFPNVYLETCSTFREPSVIERLVREAGADRVLFGSDVPLMDPRTQLGKIITADIADDEKRLVLGENAKRLLKL